MKKLWQAPLWTGIGTHEGKDRFFSDTKKKLADSSRRTTQIIISEPAAGYIQAFSWIFVLH